MFVGILRGGGLALAVVGFVSAQGQKLNGPLARPIGGDIDEYVLSPDGTHVAFVGDMLTDEVVELFSTPSDGSGTPVRLSDPGFQLSSSENFEMAYSADGTRVVYLAEDPLEGTQVWSTPADGSGPAVALARGFTFAVSPDSTRVALRGDAVTPGVFELASVPIDGSGPAVRLNAPLPPSGEIRYFLFSDDGARVLYVADQDVVGRLELYSVPSDGSAAPVKLNGPLTAGGDVGEPFGFSPPMRVSGARAVYWADQLSDNRFELFSAPIDGSAAAVRLNGTPVPSGGVRSDFDFTQDGTHVLYVSDELSEEAWALFRVPADGSGPPVVLTPGLTFGREVISFGESPDGATVVLTGYLADPGTPQLYRVPADGSAPIERLNRPTGDDGGVLTHSERSFEVSPDGRWVVYTAELDEPDLLELYRVPLDGRVRARRADGGGLIRLPVKLSGVIQDDEDVVRFHITTDGTRVVFQTFVGLFSVPLLEDGAPVTMLSLNGAIEDFALAAAGRVVFLENNLDASAVQELFGVPADGSAPAEHLNTDLPIGPVLGDVFECRFSPAGNWALFQADGEIDNDIETYIASTSGRPGTRLLAEPFDPALALFHPDGRRYLYSGDPADENVHRPYLAPFDGSAPATLVGGPFPAGTSAFPLAFTPDGARLLFSAGLVIANAGQLYSAPVDAGAPRFQLSQTLVGGQFVDRAVVSADGLRVAYRVSQFPTPILYVVPSDRSTEPVAVSTGAQGSLQPDFVFTPDGQFVLYRTLSDNNLYTTDGFSTGVLLGDATDGFVITADSSRVLLLDRNALPRKLLSAPVDASSPTLMLDQALAITGISPDSSTAFYARETGASQSRLFRTAIDGSGAPQPLTPVGGQVSSSALAADGLRVAYWGFVPVQGWGVYSVPSDGSAAPLRLTPDVGFTFVELELTPDGRTAVYVSAQADPDTEELWSVPLDGSRPPRRLNRTMAPGGNIINDIDGPRFLISADSSRVLYRADQQQESVKELFLSLLARDAWPGAAPDSTHTVVH